MSRSSIIADTFCIDLGMLSLFVPHNILNLNSYLNFSVLIAHVSVIWNKLWSNGLNKIVREAATYKIQVCTGVQVLKMKYSQCSSFAALPHKNSLA